jgi:hypothetical protein
MTVAKGGVHMLHLLFAVMLLLHGLGHTLGFWVAVPPWFALLWLLPGIGFLAGAWGYWQGEEWWPAIVGLSALGSLVILTFPTGVLRLAPFRSALAFDLLMIALTTLPWTRQLLAGL